MGKSLSWIRVARLWLRLLFRGGLLSPCDEFTIAVERCSVSYCKYGRQNRTLTGEPSLSVEEKSKRCYIYMTSRELRICSG